ncbi:MAG: ABC transporter permease [Pyrinomonadaceae bacterium]
MVSHSTNSIDSSSGGGLRRADAPPRRVTVIRPPSLRQSGVFSSLAKLAQYKDLLYTLSLHRIKVRYKQSVLGVAWAILQPLSLMLIFTVVFAYIAKMPSDGAPYPVFAYVALLPWTFFSTALANATNSLVNHAQIVTKVYFPREILPITYVIAAIFDFFVASLVFAGLMSYYRVPLTWNALYAIPIMVVLTFFATATALFMSATQVRFRDIGMAMPLLLQLWMYATPVAYPLSALDGAAPALRVAYNLNPMVGVIENFRKVMLYGRPPDFRLLALSACVSVALLVASYVYFKRVEATVADII